MKKKVLSIVAVVLVLCCAIGGTLAWLTDKTGPVVNTFTVGDINLDLSESENLNLKMVPGNTITKDPKVTVQANSEKCWLFVKVDKSANFDQYLTYTPATGWELVTGTDNVYARKVTTADFGTAFSVLQNDQVTVKGTVTEGMMTSLTTASYPTLTITAYATQLHKSATEDFTAVDAWAAASTL